MSQQLRAWEDGYYMAVIGCTVETNNYRGRGSLAAEWQDGWRQAVTDGKWGSHPDYRCK